MSWAEDNGIDGYDILDDEEIRQAKIENLDFNLSVWLDKQGNEYKITEMEISHIENCIKMLERQDLTSSKKYWVLKTEWNNRKIKELFKEK